MQLDWKTAVFVGALAAMPAAPVAAQTKYTFTVIADSSALGAIRVPVALNDSGQVAFVTTLDTGVTAVLMGSGGPVVVVADDTGEFATFGFPGMNGRGEATFYGNKLVRSGFYAGAGGSTVLIESRGAVAAFVGDIFSSPSGSVSVGHAVLRLPGFQQEIVVGDGGRATRIADTSGLFASLDLDPRVNASGAVAFHGTRRDGSDGIFVGKGGALTTIADTSGPFASFFDSPAINDRGEVLFRAIRPDGSEGLFLCSRGTTRSVLDSTGAFASFGSAPAINGHGGIAFQGTTSSGLIGIFTGGDPVADRVIAVDDAFGGSTVSSFESLAFDAALNNRGQLAFVVNLADGRTVVLRADPVRHPDHSGRRDAE